MHRWSRLFVPTLREAPADAEVASHKFLVRAGYIRQLAAGLYDYLFLGQRSILKITNIVRQEMDRIAQEFYLPALHPREVWEASGRWSVMGDNMFRLKDRKGADLCLGMTEEEIMTEIARKELRSYKQLPQIWYQIQPKFRDEPRPKSGLLRVRQFTMKDAYSFDIDAAGLDVSYKKHYETYCRIFDRCGLQYVAVEAHSGSMGGSQSHEFMVYTDAGEDLVASCPKCGYAANLEKATSRLETVEDYPPTSDGAPELVHTPGMKTIEEVANYLGVSPKNKMKTLALMAIKPDAKEGEPKERPVILFVRGDHSLNEAKLASVMPGYEFRPMHAEEVESVFDSPAGFLGPIGVNERHYKGIKATVFVDRALLGRKNLVAGANKKDYHLRNVTPGRDFEVAENQWADLRNVEEGEGCPNCGTPMRLGKAVEIGHIFKLGYKYSDSMGLRVLDKDGKEITPIMGSYGIGIERILTSIIEQNHDENGFWLPPNVAPFQVVVSATNVKDEKLLKAAVDIAEQLENAGFDVLLDDRDERPGVKFKDADLIGVPFRITIGKKLSEGKVEVLNRSTRESQDATIAEIVEILKHLIGTATGQPRASHAGGLTE
ncbi:MAG TPA: proline--tRNA ligase, partial [Terriglobales bacterium]|jgi:prolyl-tRNA synthetase|nr:proline--tRNA ligase [Terriglobales bacterium]